MRANVEQNLVQVMSELAQQFRRAQDLDMLTELSESSTIIVATFSDRTRNFIIDAVVKHINIKYGSSVYASRSELDPKVVHVWHKPSST